MRSFRSEHGRAALLLVLLLNAMFFPYIWGNMNLMSGADDTSTVTDLGGPNGNPARPVSMTRWKLMDANGSGLIDEPTFPLVHHQLFAEHEVPLWNPNLAFGTPLAAAMQQQPFYPLTAIVMAKPDPSLFAVYIVLRLFVAGFTTYLFLRFFVGFWPALGGGIAFMLNGYFIKYSTMPHLSVETLTGALFLGVEYLLRRRRPWLAVPFLAFVVWLDFLGGMPESSFINIVFAALYGAFRVFTVREYRSVWVTNVRELAIAMACGFAAAAFLLFPFGEFVVNSFNVHEPSKNGGTFPGLLPDSSPVTSLAIYLLPMIFGPPWQATDFPMNDSYFGVGIVFCAVAAIALATLVPKSAIAVPIAFFASAAVLLTAKRYGVPAVNWIGALPIVRVIALTKYQEAATAFALAALTGFGLHALFENARRRAAIAFSAFVVTSVMLQRAYDVEASLTSPAQIHAAAYFYLALLGGLVALIALGAFAALAALAAPAASDRAKRVRRLAGGLAVLALATEMSLNYFVPMYYFVDPGPPKIQNPYLGAPYIDYLHRKTLHGERVYAEKTAYLEPDWAQAFDLKDVRDIDAMYDDRYLPYVRAFVHNADSGDARDAFVGTGAYTMASPVGQKFLALGSVRYVISPDLLDPTSLAADVEAVLAARRRGLDGVPVGQVTLGGVWLHGFGQARASQDVDVPFRVSRDTRTIAFAIGLSESFWTLNRGHADFFTRLTDSRGVVRTLFARHLDERAAFRGWERHELDVRRYAGTRVRMTFGVRTNDRTGATFGYWGALREARSANEPDPFRLEKHYKDVSLFAFAHPLPHGALYENLTLSDDRTALDTLTNPDFDVFTSAVVSKESVPSNAASIVGDLSKAAPARARAAKLTSYTATRIAYVTDDPKPTLLFSSETFYPGWKAYVDAREAPILRTNYLFRGVALGPGKHTVEFRYDPLSFRVGLLLCAASFLVLLLFATLSKRAARYGTVDA